MENLSLFNSSELNSCAVPVDLESAIQQIANSATSGYLRVHRSDVKLDKQIIRYDSQPGDQYIWIIKESGAGTAMLYCGEDNIYASWGDYGERSMFFHLSCVEMGKGYLIAVNRDKAQEIFETYQERPNREPRRLCHKANFEKLLPGINLDNSLLLSELRTNPREEVIVSVNVKSASLGHIVLIRTKLYPNQYEDEARIKRVRTIAIQPSSQLILEQGIGEARYFKFKNTQQFYCEVTPCTERVFINALSKWS